MGRRVVFFIIATLIMVSIIWGNPVSRLTSVIFPTPPEPIAVSETVGSLALTVDDERLWQHVLAVSQPRFGEGQKAAVRDYIAQTLASYGLGIVQQQYAHPETNQPETGGLNIVAEIPGRDAAAGTYVLGAHYDTHKGSPGADDNGSAIAAVLEAARLFSDTANQNEGRSPFDATLKLVFFDQEERQPDGSGLLGSLAFTNSTNNVAGVNGAIILDMIGYACRTAGCQQYPERLPLQNVPETGDFLAVLGLAEDPELIGAFMGSTQKNWPLVMSLPIPKAALTVVPDLLRSDHAPFWEKDIPAVFVTDTANFRNPNYHTAGDTPETIDRSFFRGCAQHVVNATAALLSQSASES
ncbi:MAG: M28 family peptidase [Cyanobacteria bacterium J06627_28]